MHHIYHRGEFQIPEPDNVSQHETWRFAQQILGRPIPHPNAAYEARRKRELLEWLAQISDNHAKELSQLQAAEGKVRRDREVLERAAQISPGAEHKLRALELREAAEREVEAALIAESQWNELQHPRVQKGQYGGGRWTSPGKATVNTADFAPSSPFQTAEFGAGRPSMQLAAFSGGAAGTWPTTGPMPSWLPKVDVRLGADARVATGTLFSVIAGALRNGKMARYSQYLPPQQLMVYMWVFELDKRVQAGTLSEQQAKEIFTQAVLGADAQRFAPTGNVLSAVHKSALDFLDKAQQVYFAKKKKPKPPPPASLPGAYQRSGGRVFPTKQNSGLDGHALRDEQERFFERRLREGAPVDELRGQAHDAGVERNTRSLLADPDVELTLERAIENAKKKRRGKQ